MSQSFAALFEESVIDARIRPGSIIKATVVDIDKDFVTVNAGLKSEGLIHLEEFLNNQGELEVALGDEVDVALEAIEDGTGETLLSRDKAKRQAAWTSLTEIFEQGQTIVGLVTDRVKGGFTVDLDRIRAFLPGSLVDVRPVRDPRMVEGKELEFKIIKMDPKRNNVVVSRRAVLQEENTAERQALLDNLSEGQQITGIVKNLTDYGAFIDLGGLDGLLHITDMSWRRIKHPSELLTTGQELTVKILKFDREKNRVSLGMKQLGDDPWVDLISRYPIGMQLEGQVTNITDYGCFVELEAGVEGLVHMSEMDWTNKNIHPSKVVQLGQQVAVMVLEVDTERRRISLGMKQCVSNPWQQFNDRYHKGDKITGVIKSITDFGIFIGLEGGIDGLVHLSDITWDEQEQDAVQHYKKGQQVEAVILGIDAERERISLGIKQLSSEPFTEYLQQHPRGSVVQGRVESMAPKEALIRLSDDVQGQLSIQDASSDPIHDMSDAFRVGDTIEAKIMSVDRKNRQVQLSIKAKDMADERDALEQLNKHSEELGSSKLGDLFQAEMNTQDPHSDR